VAVKRAPRFVPAPPDWFANVPAERACHWQASEGYSALFGNVLSGYVVYVTMITGEVLAGTTAGTRGAWTGIPYLGIRLTEGKRITWLHVATIAEAWSDRGPDARVLISRMRKK
jgi:hypothetical protein